MKFRILLTAALAIAVAAGQNLLVNGDFEQVLTNGWTQTYGGSGTRIFDRDTSYHPDPDYEGYVQQYSGSGWARLAQSVTTGNDALLLSFSAWFSIGAGSSTCWPVAAVCVEYLNSSSAVLGETRFYSHNAYCNWTGSSTLHLIEVTSTSWEDYELDVHQELIDNLPGVNPDSVRGVQISLYCYTSGG